MSRVALLDYGMGNLHSVAKALEHVGASHVDITRDPALIARADRIVLPGQGAMRECMQAMRDGGIDVLVRELIGHKPLLGICVVMQALLSHSQENEGVDGLAIYPGQVRFFGHELQENGQRLKIPHMGWNEVWQQGEHPLWQGIADGSRFYFVHSYYCQPEHAELCQAYSDYGLRFCAALGEGAVFAVQFHPEKSQRAGLTLLRNFLNWRP